MVRSSGQHKCGLIFCGIMMVVLGSGITITGFLNDFAEPYDDLAKPELANFTHTQYWLGIPLFLLGIYVIVTSCCKVSCLMVFGLVAASLVLILSIFALVLEGPEWRNTLKPAVLVSQDRCKETNGTCACPPEEMFAMTCDEVKYRLVIYTFMVAFAVIATPICFFSAFIYVRILGWMLHISFDDPIDDYYAKAVNSHFINGHHGRGIGRANDVALGTYPQ